MKTKKFFRFLGHIKPLPISSLLLFILLSNFSCQKVQNLSSKLEKNLSQNEKSIVEKWIKGVNEKAISSKENHLDSFYNYVDWNKSVKITISNSSKSIFYIPILNKQIGLSLFFDERKNSIDSGNIVLVNCKNNESPITGIKTYYESIVLKNNEKNNFSGSISSYTISKKHLHDYGFKNGKIEWQGIYAPRNVSNQIIRSFSNNNTRNLTTYDCEWWGHYTIWSDGVTTLDYTYLVCKLTGECQTTLIKTPNGYQVFKSNCGGGGGNSSPESEPFGIDCESFIFVQTASNWQEAGIKNHRMNMVWLGGQNYRLPISLTITSPIIIGLPKERDNGNIIYSSGKAAEIAAEIIQTATILTHKVLKDEPNRPSDELIERTFRDFLSEVALLYAGTAGRTGSGSSAIYTNSNPKYKIFGTGDCD